MSSLVHSNEFIPCDLHKLLLFFQFIHSIIFRAVWLRISGDMTMNFGRHDNEFRATSLRFRATWLGATWLSGDLTGYRGKAFTRKLEDLFGWPFTFSVSGFGILASTWKQHWKRFLPLSYATVLKSRPCENVIFRQRGDMGFVQLGLRFHLTKRCPGSTPYFTWAVRDYTIGRPKLVSFACWVKRRT